MAEVVYSVDESEYETRRVSAVEAPVLAAATASSYDRRAADDALKHAFGGDASRAGNGAFGAIRAALYGDGDGDVARGRDAPKALDVRPGALSASRVEWRLLCCALADDPACRVTSITCVARAAA